MPETAKRDLGFRVCVRTTLAIIAVPKGRPKGYTPPTTISPEGTADNTQDDNPGTNFSGLWGRICDPMRSKEFVHFIREAGALVMQCHCQCRHPIFAGDASYVSVKFALQVRRYRLPTLRSCKYNVNQAINVTMSPFPTAAAIYKCTQDSLPGLLSAVPRGLLLVAGT